MRGGCGQARTSRPGESNAPPGISASSARAHSTVLEMEGLKGSLSRRAGTPLPDMVGSRMGAGSPLTLPDPRCSGLLWFEQE